MVEARRINSWNLENRSQRDRQHKIQEVFKDESRCENFSRLSPGIGIFQGWVQIQEFFKLESRIQRSIVQGPVWQLAHAAVFNCNFMTSIVEIKNERTIDWKGGVWCSSVRNLEVFFSSHCLHLAWREEDEPNKNADKVPQYRCQNGYCRVIIDLDSGVRIKYSLVNHTHLQQNHCDILSVIMNEPTAMLWVVLGFTTLRNDLGQYFRL